MQLFLVTDPDEDPISLASECDHKTFIHPLKLPVPKQIIIFSIGDWSNWSHDTHLMVELLTQLGAHNLGTITDVKRCLYWKKNEYDQRTDLDMLPTSDTLVSLVVSVVGEQLTNQHSSREINAAKDKEHPPNTTIKVLKIASILPNTNPLAKPVNLSDSPTKKRKKSKKKNKNENKENCCNWVAEKQDAANVVKLKRLDSFPTKTDKMARVDFTDDGGDVAWCQEVSCKDRPMPSSRWGHSMTYIGNNEAVLIGGQGDKSQLCKDSVWILNTETRKWHAMKASTENHRPETRLGHTTTFDPLMRCVYVYGGCKSKQWLHDVHMLDLDTWSWSVIKTPDKGPHRSYHSTTLHRHELWVFGGIYPVPDPHPDGCSNDLIVFSPISQTWYKPVVKGNKPLPRSGHSANMFGNKLVIFGGWDFPICYSELFILDTSKMEWSQPTVSGSAPKPRSWHGAALLSANQLLIHGGYDGNVPLDDTHILNLNTLSWSQIKVDNSPPARAGHSIISLPYTHEKGKNDEIIVFGGGDNDDAYFKDVFSLIVPFGARIVPVKVQIRDAFSELMKLSNIHAKMS